MSLICVNGQFLEETKVVIPITHKEYFFDFAVYSSLKVIQSQIFFPDHHIDRLFESATIIGLEHNFTKTQILNWLEQLVAKNQLKDAFLRIILIGDATGNKDAKLYLFPLTGVHYYPNKLYKKGIKVITYEGERRFPTAKTKDLLLSFLAYREAEQENAVDALLIDKEGYIREGTRSNFFAIKDNVLFSPPKDKILEGITKKIIFDICKDTFQISEQNIPYAQIQDYDEIFITSILFNILPINQIDDLALKSDFPKTAIIQKLFKEFYKKVVLKK